MDMREIMEWQGGVSKTFKVSELQELLRAKNMSVNEMKQQKGMEVAWHYTKEEIADWRRKRRTPEPPALMVNRYTRQNTMNEFFPNRRCCEHEYVREHTTGPRDNGEYTERCNLCGNVK